MKYFFLLLALVGSFSLVAQEADLFKKTNGQVEVSEVILLDSFPAAQLHFNSKLFLNDAFQSVRETSQIKDDKAKSVATKGSFPVTIQNGSGDELKAKVIFTLIIQCRENMYKYVLNDFYFAYTEETGITSYASFNDHLGMAMTKKQWQEVELQSDEFIRSFVAGLKQQMKQTDILCKEALAANKKRK